MEFKVYNARPIQKLTIACFVLLCVLIIAVPLSLSFSQLKKVDFIIAGSILLCVLGVAFASYFILRKQTDSLFIFDAQGIKRFHGDNIIFYVEWQNVLSVYHFRTLPTPIFDFEKIGAGFLRIEYLDFNNSYQMLLVSFAKKHAKILQKSQINTKLENIM